MLHALPVLLSRWEDLVRRDYKATLTRASRPELECPRELSTSNIIDVIHTSTRGLVNSLTGRAINEVEAIDALDGLRDARRQFHLGIQILNNGAAAVAIWQQDKLAEGMPVDVELDAHAVCDAEGVVREDLHLGSVTRRLAAVSLGARVR